MTSIAFTREYLCKPIASESSLFPEEVLRSPKTPNWLSPITRVTVRNTPTTSGGTLQSAPTAKQTTPV